MCRAREQRTCDVTHAQTVYIDDVIERVNHENKAERVQIDESLDERCGRYDHAVTIQEPSKGAHLHRNETDTLLALSIVAPVRLRVLLSNERQCKSEETCRE